MLLVGRCRWLGRQGLWRVLVLWEGMCQQMKMESSSRHLRGWRIGVHRSRSQLSESCAGLLCCWRVCAHRHRSWASKSSAGLRLGRRPSINTRRTRLLQLRRRNINNRRTRQITTTLQTRRPNTPTLLNRQNRRPARQTALQARILRAVLRV